MLFPLHPALPDPDKVAFRMCESGRQVSFAELDAKANQVAHAVNHLGLQPGDHVAVLMNNTFRKMALTYAPKKK